LKNKILVDENTRINSQVVQSHHKQFLSKKRKNDQTLLGLNKKENDTTLNKSNNSENSRNPSSDLKKVSFKLYNNELQGKFKLLY
jgi:hypothetical protein